MDDLLIVGGSAAGTGAAIYAARRNLKARVIAIDLGGEVVQSGEIENWPGIIHTTGIELSMAFEKHLRSFDLPIEVGVTAQSIDKEDAGFVVRATKDGQDVTYQAKAVILATGVHPRVLGIPGEKELKNRGLSYCTVCDGPLYRGKKVVTIGGGNSALESALMLSSFASHVTLVNKNPDMKGEAVLIDKVHAAANITYVPNSLTTKIVGAEFVTGILYQTKDTGEIQQLETDGVFVHIGMIPNSDCVHGIEKNPFGEIMVTKLGETSVPGLFAAGDVTDIPFKQIAIASGQGVTAALQAVRYLDNLA